eukprot:scaffold35192_cov129-Isochrysis_galbana.AAC.4
MQRTGNGFVLDPPRPSRPSAACHPHRTAPWMIVSSAWHAACRTGCCCHTASSSSRGCRRDLGAPRQPRFRAAGLAGQPWRTSPSRAAAGGCVRQRMGFHPHSAGLGRSWNSISLLQHRQSPYDVAGEVRSSCPTVATQASRYRSLRSELPPAKRRAAGMRRAAGPSACSAGQPAAALARGRCRPSPRRSPLHHLRSRASCPRESLASGPQSEARGRPNGPDVTSEPEAAMMVSPVQQPRRRAPRCCWRRRHSLVCPACSCGFSSAAS